MVIGPLRPFTRCRQSWATDLGIWGKLDEWWLHSFNCLHIGSNMISIDILVIPFGWTLTVFLSPGLGAPGRSTGMFRESPIQHRVHGFQLAPTLTPMAYISFCVSVHPPTHLILGMTLNCIHRVICQPHRCANDLCCWRTIKQQLTYFIPPDPDNMTTTAPEATASSSGKNCK